MGVTEDADVRLLPIQKGSPVFRELPAFIHDVTDGDAEAGQIDHSLGQKSVGQEWDRLLKLACLHGVG